MEPFGDEPWDVVICGTGLQQSLLALALSRSDKRILHLDPNDYYGQHQAALTLPEADQWAASHAGVTGAQDGGEAAGLFRRAAVWRHPEAEARGLGPARSYALALAPQIVHTKAQLLSQLVSSRAYRQVEFLAVGGFFVYEAAAAAEEKGGVLSRVPSSREDIFSSTAIAAKAKRALMKFLKFVLDHDSSDEQRAAWLPHADAPLATYLTAQFKLDNGLRDRVLALTLSLDGRITVRGGLAILHRHLTSTGLFGPGFCAVYPKWGGLSEVAQVGCRAGAVGGGIYMLATRMTAGAPDDQGRVPLALSNDLDVVASSLVGARDAPSEDKGAVSRLVAVVRSPLGALFQAVVEGAPNPAVAVVAFPASAIPSPDEEEEESSTAPIYAMVHSSDTGECPVGQCTIYLTTMASATSKQRLERALEALLSASGEPETPVSLYQLYYEQGVSEGSPPPAADASPREYYFPSPSLNLSFDDADLDAVKTAWKMVMGDQANEDEYMTFADREGADAEDEIYDNE